MGDSLSPEESGFDPEERFGDLGRFEAAPRGLRHGFDTFVDGDTPGDQHQNYHLGELKETGNGYDVQGGAPAPLPEGYYYVDQYGNPLQPQQQQQYLEDGMPYHQSRARRLPPASRALVNQPGDEGALKEEEDEDATTVDKGYNGKFRGRLRGAVRQLRGKRTLEEENQWRSKESRLRAEQRVRRKAVRNYQSARRIRRRRFPRTAEGFKKAEDDAEEQITDTQNDAESWNNATKDLKRHQDNAEVLGSGWGWLKTAGETITFSMSGVLPDGKKFMDPDAYRRVNRTLLQLSDEQIEQEKQDAMDFFDSHFGIDFKEDGQPMQGEEDVGSLCITGLATLRPYAISPSLKFRATTAVSDGHPIEAGEKVHEAGWVVTVIADRGAELGGAFGGRNGRSVRPGTTMKYGTFHFRNPKYDNDDAEIHFESSEPSLPGGSSGHTLHNLRVHDLSFIDGDSKGNKKGAWGHATAVVTERKLVGDRKKLGELYGRTAARAQITINITQV